jgi:hypothetical protein
MNTMSKFDMTYNSQKDILIISEYGRHVQNLVLKIKEEPDANMRQLYAEEIISLLNIINPANKGLVDYKEKLWNHLFRIANYDLDVKVPDGINIHPIAEKPKAHLPYPVNTFNYRHYGHFIQKMIKKGMEMEPGQKRDTFAEVVGSFMKLAYRTWHKEHYVNDEIIREDLLEMSEGKLDIKENFDIDYLVNSKTRRKQAKASVANLNSANKQKLGRSQNRKNKKK